MEVSELTRDRYAAVELAKFHAELARKKANEEEIEHALDADVDIIVERCEWLADGSYGAGAYQALRNLGKRMNRRAWLYNTIMGLEWGLSQRQACASWHKRTPSEQRRIDTGLDKILADIDNPQGE